MRTSYYPLTTYQASLMRVARGRANEEAEEAEAEAAAEAGGGDGEGEGDEEAFVAALKAAGEAQEATLELQAGSYTYYGCTDYGLLTTYYSLQAECTRFFLRFTHYYLLLTAGGVRGQAACSGRHGNYDRGEWSGRDPGISCRATAATLQG